MKKRPRIFISAVGHELRSARQLVADTLLSLGCEPVWQDIACTGEGDLRGTMRKQIDSCGALIQLIGQCHGPEPPEPDAEFGRVSYTQYEALYAWKSGKKVWFLSLGDGLASKGCETEPEELRALQRAYSERLQAGGHVFLPLIDSASLENKILRLRGELAKLRGRWKRRAALVLGVVCAIAAGARWILVGDYELVREDHPVQQDANVGPIAGRKQKMEQAIIRLADVELDAKQPGEKLAPDELRKRAFTILENEMGLPAGSLATELADFALRLHSAPDTAPLMRARAAYALNKFEEAEKLFLPGEARVAQAMANAGKDADKLRAQRTFALMGAGESALAQDQCGRSFAHLQSAVALTDRERDPIEWARVQHRLAFVQSALGDPGQAALILPPVIEIRQRLLGPENPDTLRSRNNLAGAFHALGRDSEAEAEHRAILEIRQRVPGSEQEETLASRNNLALTLYAQRKFAEAGAEYRAVAAVRTRTLGPEHPETLGSRYSLAVALRAEGKLAEAEAEQRAIFAIRTRVLGAEHPDTLASRNCAALLLGDLGRYAEAEAEHRALIDIAGRIVGPDDPDTLMSRSNLALALLPQGKADEAEVQQRIVLEARERILGPEDPQTLASRKALAVTLANQQRPAEAEREFRTVLEIQRRLLGPEHPGTLGSANSLAGVLNDRGQHAEAEAEFRSLCPIMERVLGPESRETLGARNNLANALERQNKFAEAEAEHKAVLAIQERSLGGQHPDVIISYFNLAICLDAQGKKAEALGFAKRAWEGQRKLAGEQHPFTRETRRLVDELEKQ